MRQALLLLLTAVLVGCTEQQDYMAATMPPDSPATHTKTPADYMAKARWGDGDAYLKLADYYITGDLGVKPDLMMAMTMLTMASEYGRIPDPRAYVSSLPEDDNTRMGVEAMNGLERKDKERVLELVERLAGKGHADGYALKSYATYLEGDSTEGMRLATIAAEQGSTLGKALTFMISYGWKKDMPDESIMFALAESAPIFYLFMAEEYICKSPDSQEHDEKIARCYMKADEHGCLDKQGARWLLRYLENGNNLMLDGTDKERLETLAREVPAELQDDEQDNTDSSLWEAQTDTMAVEAVANSVSEAAETVEKATRNLEKTDNY